MEYRIIESDETGLLENPVNDILNAGGKTVGGVCADSRMGKFYQAVMVPKDYNFNSGESRNKLASTSNSVGSVANSSPDTSNRIHAIAMRRPAKMPQENTTNFIRDMFKQNTRRSRKNIK